VTKLSTVIRWNSAVELMSDKLLTSVSSKLNPKGSTGAGIRRIEAVCGPAAEAFLGEQQAEGIR
jgi:hypothetical protein